MGKGEDMGEMELASQDAAQTEVDVVLVIDPATLTHGERLTWDRQDRFLEAFVQLGTIQKAAASAEISRSTVEWWTKGDKLGFVERYRQARADRRDYAEDKYILHRLDNPKGNYGTDVAAIAYMNRLDPENWTRGVRVTHDVPNELIQQLRQLQALGNQPVAKPKVVDGEAEVMPWE